jgi:hypothetical protein
MVWKMMRSRHNPTKLVVVLFDRSTILEASQLLRFEVDSGVWVRVRSSAARLDQ